MKKIFAVIVVALFLRLWHLSETAQFSYDEARDAIEERKILSGDLTMLGPESQIGDKLIYFGPLHYYLMAPALKFSDFDPLGPYFFTALFGGVTAGLLAWQFGWAAGLLYAVFPVAVIYNRWSWNPNTIPLFIALSLIFYRNKKYFWTGIFWGLAVQMHWMAIAFGIVVLLNRTFYKVIFGLILGISPIIIFDFRHEFLYTRSLFDFFINPIGRSLTWHYFLWVIPVLTVYLQNWLKFVVIFISLTVTLFWLANLKSVLPMHPLYLEMVAGTILADQALNPQLNFNIVNFHGGDFRATNIRYFLEEKTDKLLDKSMYDVADHLYVFTNDSREAVLYNGLYEVASFKPTAVSKSWKIAGSNLYRLEK